MSAQVRDFLSSENMDMIHAGNAEDAITLVQRHHPDCVLVDLGSSRGNGHLLDTLLKSPLVTQLPLVLLTNDDEIYEKYRSEVSARVKRSFRKSSLLSGIHNALNRGISFEQPIGDKVLLIDDDPEILAFMRRCLENEGFAIDQCQSGEKALELLSSGEFGLVLLDIAMPGMDGWETCARIKGDPALKGLKVYLVTAKSIDRDMQRLNRCGADGFLLKPFRPTDLIQLAQRLELRTVAK